MNSTNISVRISENATVRLHWLCTELRSAWKQLLPVAFNNIVGS